MMNNINAQVVKGVQSLKPYQPGKPESELKRELGLESIIKLASNENPLGCSLQVQKALQDYLQNCQDIAIYPDGSGHSLKSSLVNYFSKHENIDGLLAEQITLGSGSNDVLDMIVRVFADSDSDVIMSQYAFAVYYISTKAVGANPVIVKAKADYGHDLPAMLNAITEKTKLIFIANPNNPTGTSLSYHELFTFVEQVPKHVMVVIDEAYSEYLSAQNDSSEDSSTNKMASFIDQLSYFDNVIITRTFSKIYGLASLRVGFALSSLAIADFLNRVRHPFNVNAMALIAAEAAISDQEFVNKSCQLNASQKQVWYDAFDDMQLSYIDSAANFVTVDFGSPEKAEKLNQFLLNKGIIVRDLIPYQMPNFLRITIGDETQNRLTIEAIKEFFHHVID